jgi:hypothetical protein
MLLGALVVEDINKASGVNVVVVKDKVRSIIELPK